MKKRYIFALGAAYGLVMRLAFGMLPFLNQGNAANAGGPMLSAFVLLVPTLIGVFTVYAARDDEPGVVGQAGRGEPGLDSGITALALFSRFASRQDESFSAKVIAALRNEFGGHAVKTEAPPGGDAAPTS